MAHPAVSLHVALRAPLGVALAGAVALAGLAATAALALLCFAKVLGLTLLGEPRSAESRDACDAPAGMRAAMVSLAGMCIALGLLPGLVLPTLAALAPGSGGSTLAVHAGLQIPGTGSYPPVAIAVAICVLSGAILLARGRRRAAPAPGWACGQPLTPELRWTSAGFSKPLTLVLESILRPRREIEVTRAAGVLQGVTYKGETPALLDAALDEPTIRSGLRVAALARRMQSGNVRTYAAYLLGLVIALLVLVHAGALG